MFLNVSCYAINYFTVHLYGAPKTLGTTLFKTYSNESFLILTVLHVSPDIQIVFKKLCLEISSMFSKLFVTYVKPVCFLLFGNRICLHSSKKRLQHSSETSYTLVFRSAFSKFQGNSFKNNTILFNFLESHDCLVRSTVWL